MPGEALWVGFYLGLGYSFGDAWRAVSQAASEAGGLLMVATVLLAAAYLAYPRLTGSRRRVGHDVLSGTEVPGRKDRFFISQP